jgi:predicted dehydrogenase
MIRIGVVNIDTSHPVAFARILHAGSRARYVALYNDGFRDDEECATFIRGFGLEARCRTIAELADRVDVGFLQSTNWDLHVKHAIPFIERHKPVFIDKPLVGNLKDCLKLEQLAAQGAVILGCSSVRYAPEIDALLARPAAERGEIVSVFGTVGVDEFNYACHIVEAIGAVAGAGAETVRHAAGAVSGEHRCDTYTVEFGGGRSAVFSVYQGQYQPFELSVITTKTVHHFRIDTGKIYAALLERVMDAVEGRRDRIAPLPHLTESVKILLAGKVSKAAGGRPIRINALKPDMPGFDGTAFIKEYAKASRRLVLP